MGHLRIFCVEAEVDFEVAKADFEIYENMEDACHDRAARKYSWKKILGMSHNFKATEGSFDNTQYRK